MTEGACKRRGSRLSGFAASRRLQGGAGWGMAIDRRTFLGAALTLPAAAGVSIRGAEAGGGRRIRAGMLGVAYSHAAEKIRLLRVSPDYEFVGAWAETEALGVRWAGEGVVLRTRDDRRREVEVVFVESEVARHAADAQEALEAGRHVHLEKPPAMGMAEFDALVALARERKRLLQVGYMWRHNPAFLAVFEAVRRGWLGEVFLVRATVNNTLGGDRRREWAAYPGGVLFELGSHMVDAVTRLMGRPQRVEPFLRTHGGEDDLRDNNVAVLEFGRALAVVTSATLQPNASAHRALEVFGTRGTAVVRPIEPPVLTLDLAAAAGPYARGMQSVPMPGYSRYVGELEELAGCVREGRALPVSLEEERLVQETLLRVCGVMR